MNLKTITFDVEPVHPLPELKQPTNVLDSMLRRNALIIANARRLIRDKRMSNSRLYAELFGTGMGIAIKRCDEMGLCPESNKTSYSEMINEIDAQVQAQSCATPANDEPVGVARTNAMLKQGDTFCVFELGSVPEGTKLYTRPQPAKVTPETAVVPDELKEICGLIARIFFYGNFVAETYNERELEKLLRKNGYFAESEDELMEIIQRLPSRNA